MRLGPVEVVLACQGHLFKAFVVQRRADGTVRGRNLFRGWRALYTPAKARECVEQVLAARGVTCFGFEIDNAVLDLREA